MAVSADRAVATSAALTILSTTAASMLPEDLGGRAEMPSMQLLFGSALTFTGLSILADFAPGLAKGLAISIMFTALAYHGLPLLNAYASPKKTTTKKKRAK